MKVFWLISGLALILTTGACTSQDQEKAREDVRKADNEIKADAKELRQRADAAVKPDSRSASDKLADASAKAQNAAANAGIKLDHAALVAKVTAKLASDAGLLTLKDMTVSVDGSEVTLTGQASSEDQKKEAGQAAAQVEGITAVHNNLVVQP